MPAFEGNVSPVLSARDRIFPVETILTPRPNDLSSIDSASGSGAQSRSPYDNPFESTFRGFMSSLESLGHQDKGSFTLVSGPILGARLTSFCMSVAGDIREGQLGTYQMRGTSHSGGCTAEDPIQEVSFVQQHGLLVVLEEADETGKFVVQAVSDNSKDIISFTPSELLELNSFTDILSSDQADLFKEQIELNNPTYGGDATESVPDVFTLSVGRDEQEAIHLRCAVHRSPTQPRLILCDMEIKPVDLLPLVSSTPPMAIEPGRMPTPALTSPRSEVLGEKRVGNSALALRRIKRPVDSLGILQTMSKVQDRLAMARDLEQLVESLAGLVREFTGFERILVCQYDRHQFGRVVAEVAAANMSAPLYHGLRFRATNITGRHGDSLKSDDVSVLYERDAAVSQLVYRQDGVRQDSVDLAHSFLRKPLPIRTLHEDDMDVQSAMSIYINGPTGLWGVIECYAASPCGERVSFLTRKLCGLISNAAWTNIQRLSAESRLRAWKMIQSMRLEGDPTISTRQLLNSFRADSGFLLEGEQVETLGQLQHPQQALVILKYLAVRDIISVIASTDLRKDFPDLECPLGFDGISGVLVVPLCLGGNEFMVFFRDAKLQEIKWAGNPYRTPVADDSQKEGRRRSFQTWTELTTEMGEAWSEDEIETATVLCLLSEKAKRARKQAQTVSQSHTVAQLLLKNAAHELRTPLNAIVNYLELARNGTLGPEIREQLDRSHAASQSLTQVINEMLGVDGSEERRP